VKTKKDFEALFKGFSKLSREERFARLVALGALAPEDVNYLNQSIDPTVTALAENFVENVIGCFPLPLGVATNFHIDDRDYIIPMAVEETSIIAAASRTARWIRENGYISTEIVGSTIIGQIQIAKIKNFAAFKAIIELHQQALIDKANQEVVPNLVARGGGVKNISVRHLLRDDGAVMAIVHVMLNPCDAMGANVVTQVCEYLRNPIQELTGETVSMCILSNLNDSKLTRAKVVLRNIDPAQGEAIMEASLFAEADPYRAATHNKGVLNGIDPILIATGNDWRAVEAGIHAYAARSGHYQSVTSWRMHGADLVGQFEAPVSVGIVGGVTRLHPTAQLSLRILNITSADELSRVIAAVGLVQNLGAIRALTGEGIVKGHMKLHINNLLLAAGATQEEQIIIKKQLEEHLNVHAKITLSDATALLAKLRAEQRVS
jgi:hydroxymethylglutaryl-CoA reductase